MRVHRFRFFACFFFATSLVLAPDMLRAEAGGPDYWKVKGVAADDQLMVHDGPSARSRVIGKLAHDATGVRNLGCKGVPSFSEWQKMTPAERERSSRGRWCRVSHDKLTGWVAGRFLAEGSAPSAQQAVTVGAWSARCEAGSCAIEQKGIAAHRPTILRIEPQEQVNARISIVRRDPPRSGTLSIYADGDELSAGPIAPLAAKHKDRLVMEPDDITLGLLKGMRRHKNMVISFPGEERGVEFHVERLDEALKELDKLRSTRR